MTCSAKQSSLHVVQQYVSSHKHVYRGTEMSHSPFCSTALLTPSFGSNIYVGGPSMWRFDRPRNNTYSCNTTHTRRMPHDSVCVFVAPHRCVEACPFNAKFARKQHADVGNVSCSKRGMSPFKSAATSSIPYGGLRTCSTILYGRLLCGNENSRCMPPCVM